MSDYKLVPVEPTEEMLRVACDEEQRPLPMWSRMKAIYTAMLASAPTVQGDPVVWMYSYIDGTEVQTSKERWTGSDWKSYWEETPLYAAPQPPLQLPDLATYPNDSDEGASLWDHGYKRGWNACLEAATDILQPAEQQPDVAGLVEALESLIKGYVGLLEAGMDRITSLGGDCDPVAVMEQNDPWLRDARAALAAHRKQGR